MGLEVAESKVALEEQKSIVLEVFTGTWVGGLSVYLIRRVPEVAQRALG